MRMNRMAALTLGAGLFTMAACSDAPTAAPSAAALPKTPSLVVGVPFDGPAPTAEVGKIVLCKVGNIGGSFDFTETPEGPAQDPNGAVANDMSLDAGKCVEVATDNSPDGSGNQVQIHELDAADPANTTQEVVSCKFRSKNPDGSTNPEVDCEVYADNQKLFLNAFHGFVVTYRNTFTEPPPEVCTYTKGWYQNKNGAPTIIDGILGVSKGDQFKIFSATPGKPGDVKWAQGGGTLNNKPNNALNLYQQLLAALNNLGGNATAGPDDVDDAIADAIAAITIVNGTTFRVANGADISGLTNTLSAFNEGQFKGYPHCGDEILVQ